MTNTHVAASTTVGRTLRQGLSHPVIDVDGHLQELSTFFKQDVVDYAREIGVASVYVDILVEIHRQVSTNYVDPVDEQELREKAIEGMLSDLDPYSVYIPPAEQEDFDRLK